MKPFGKLLAELRRKAGLSQNDLAQIIKTNPTHISKIERGDRKPPKMNTLIEMAKALRIHDDKEIMSDFLSSAIRSRIPRGSLSYSSPLSEDDITILVNEESKRKYLESPAIRSIISILDDPEMPADYKKEAETQILSFASWVKHNIESELKSSKTKKQENTDKSGPGKET